MARAQNAALFISIHADALAKNEGEARGAAIYTLSETASDAEAGKLAEADNKADLIAGVDLSGEPDDVADILIDLAQRETKHFSVHFAKTLHAELKTSAKFHKHPLKSAGFRVLTAPDVPSVLVELGYVTSRQDLKLMTSESWRARATDRAESHDGGPPQPARLRAARRERRLQLRGRHPRRIARRRVPLSSWSSPPSQRHSMAPFE